MPRVPTFGASGKPVYVYPDIASRVVPWQSAWAEQCRARKITDASDDVFADDAISSAWVSDEFPDRFGPKLRNEIWSCALAWLPLLGLVGFRRWSRR